MATIEKRQQISYTKQFLQLFSKSGTRVKPHTWKNKDGIINIDNHMIYARYLGEKLGYRKMEDWYNITRKDFIENKGGGLLGPFYKNAPSQFLKAMFPDYEWLEWKFDHVPYALWKDKNNHKRYAEWLGEKMGYTKKEDWYKIIGNNFRDNHCSGLFGHYNCSPSQFVMAMFPDYEWLEWKFIKTPHAFGKDKNNDKKYAKWLGKKLGYTIIEDWYNITYNAVCESWRGLLGKRYNDSPTQFVMEMFPDYEWLEWKFVHVPQGYWKDKNNNKKYAKWLGKELGYTKKKDWYKIMQKYFYDNYGSGLLASYYNNSPIQFVMAMFPDYEWLSWKFWRVPQGYWKDKNNHKKYAKWLGKKLGYTIIEDWYKITQKDFKENHGIGLLGKRYNSSPSQFVMTMFPDYEWLPWKFDHAPGGYWKDKNNHKKYAKWLGEKLAYTKKDDWYNILKSILAKNYGGGLMANYYNGSPSKFVMAMFPDYEWERSKFKKGYSHGQIQWLEFLKVSTPDIRHILNHDDGEFYVPGSREFCGGGVGYHVDGFSETEHKIYEYLGDECHGNPAIYKPDYFSGWVKATASKLYNNELKRRKFCEDSGFGYHSIWESEWHRGIKAIRKLQRKFKNRITFQ